MQKTLSQTIQTIKKLPSGIGDIIWSFYYEGNKTIRQNYVDMINEFKDIIKSVSKKIDYTKFKKNKSNIKYALEKKYKPVNQCGGSIFPLLHMKYCTHTQMRGIHLTSLDIFTTNMEEKFLVFTLEFKEIISGERFWKNYPKKNFIIKYLLFNYCQEYYLDNTCAGIIKKTGARCCCWLKPNCNRCNRCNRHKFK